MILVTGGTGFVGRHLVEQLIASGKQVRILLRPSKKSPNLPRGTAVEAAVCSLLDERGLRAAMRGVDEIFHLAGTERHSSRAELQDVDIHGTEMLAAAAAQSGIRRILFLSHLGADRASAYPLLKAKAMAESAIVGSGVPYTILRSAVIYGPGDQFTTSLARLLRLSPGIFLIPGDGSSLLQPLWIHDVVSCLLTALENEPFAQQTISIGGIETLTFRQVVEQVMTSADVHRRVVSVSPATMRIIALFTDMFRRFPVSIFWLDYLSANRTTALDSLPRTFGILPARFHTQLGYLARTHRPVLTQKGIEG
jgi:NADH dehydrogenase